MKVIALYSIKGGVGKTSAAVNLAYLASREGRSVLLMDLDPQGAASFYFRIRARKKFRSKQFVKGGTSIEDNIRGTDHTGLDSLPSHLSFGKMDLHLNRMKKPGTRLKKILRPLAGDYELVFLDCPPNLTLLSENVFRSADLILVPAIPTPLSLLAYDKLMAFFSRKNLDDSRIRAFFSMMEKRKSIHTAAVRDKSAADPRFFKSVIPYAADVEKMGITREPLFCYAPSSPAAAAFESLWKEISHELEIQ